MKTNLTLVILQDRFGEVTDHRVQIGGRILRRTNNEGGTSVMIPFVEIRIAD